MESSDRGVRLRLFGPLEAAVGGDVVDLGSTKQRTLLARLAVSIGQVVSRDQLIDALWAEDPPGRADASIAAYVSNLRRVLEPDRAKATPPAVLVTRSPGYLLAAEAATTDLAAYEELLGSAVPGEPGERDRLVAALDIAGRAPFLPDHVYDDWAAAAIARVDQSTIEAEERLHQLDLDHGQVRIAELEALVDQHPLREGARATLMLAYYRAGRQADALRCYSDGRARLADELGIEPSRRLRELELAILEQDASLDRPIEAGPAQSPAAATVGHGLVGRDGELAILRAGLATAAAGSPVAALITGPAGIGKSGLAEAVADEARATGWAVAQGATLADGGTPPLWLWARVADQLRVGHEGAGASAVLASIDHIAPRDESQWFSSIAGLADELAGLSRLRPIMIVVDDIQWADEWSIRLLGLLAQRTDRDAPLLVVATLRGDDAVGPLVRDIAAGVRRSRDGIGIDLGPLDDDAITALIDRIATDDLPAQALAAIRDRSAGRPLFVIELARAAATSEPTALPETLAAVLAQRIRKLAPEVIDHLATAALLDGACDPAIVARALDGATAGAGSRGDGAASRGAVQAVARAAEARLVEPDPLDPRLYRFSHALLREALAAELTPAERAERNAALGRVLLDTLGDRAADDPGALAKQFVAGAPAGTAIEAIEWASATATRAAAGYQFDEAERWAAAGLDVIDRYLHGEHPSQGSLLLARADALRAHSGAREAWDLYLDAFELAVASGDTSAAADVALAGAEGSGTPLMRSAWHPGPAASDLLVEAKGMLADDDPRHRRLAAAIAADGSRSLSLDEVQKLAAEAVAPDGAGAVEPAIEVHAAMATWALVPAEELEVALLDIAVRAGELGDRATEPFARHLAIIAALDRGDLNRFAHLAEEGRRRNRRLRIPVEVDPAAYATIMLGLVQGVDERLLATLERGAERVATGSIFVREVVTMSRLNAAWLSGDDGGWVDELWDYAVASRRRWLYGFGAYVHAERGDVEGAGRWLAALTPALPIDATGFGFADAAFELGARALLGDRDGVVAGLEQLEPCRALMISGGPGVTYFGPTAWYRALGHLALGDVERGEAHLAAAEAWCAQVGSAPFAARIAGLAHEQGKVLVSVPPQVQPRSSSGEPGADSQNRSSQAS